MNSQNLAPWKAKGLVGLRLQSWTMQTKYSKEAIDVSARWYTVDNKMGAHSKERLMKELVKDLSTKHKAKRQAKALEKDFFVSVLNSSATKRDARSYLQRFTLPKGTPTVLQPSLNPIALTPGVSHSTGVNLGSFYGPAAVVQSPEFIQQPRKPIHQIPEPQLHVALVKIRDSQRLDDDTLRGIGTTLTQLRQLGLCSVVVVDCDEVLESGRPAGDAGVWRTSAIEQANRIVAAIGTNDGAGARLVDNAVGVSTPSHEAEAAANTGKKAYIKYRKLVVNPVRRGIIPVLPSLGYEDDTERAVPVPSIEVMFALAKELATISEFPLPEVVSMTFPKSSEAINDRISIDRLIILDPSGGIPTSNRPNGYHVFLNMEQEFEMVQNELRKANEPRCFESLPENQYGKKSMPGIDSSNTFSIPLDTEFGSLQTNAKPESKISSHLKNTKHLENLRLSREILSILPRSSSAIITTPFEAANTASRQLSSVHTTGVGTRRHKNPLIHNLLTDKPVFSSSLPVGRLAVADCHKSRKSKETVPDVATSTTTFIKHGMSVMIFPDPKEESWAPWQPGKQLTILESQIDLPRLVHLIEDSFGRQLDVADYLERLNGRMAGIIIAGEYEGGAVLTWETPPGVVADGSPESRARMVPYLDKFAVLRRVQGSSHADIVFKSMVRDCFPDGVVWRSRSTNVVNKWYFERSLGTWKLPDTHWTMFWTTPDMDKQTFLDYEAVCRGVVPSWADNKDMAD